MSEDEEPRSHPPPPSRAFATTVDGREVVVTVARFADRTLVVAVPADAARVGTWIEARRGERADLFDVEVLLGDSQNALTQLVARAAAEAARTDVIVGLGGASAEWLRTPDVVMTLARAVVDAIGVGA